MKCKKQECKKKCYFFKEKSVKKRNKDNTNQKKKNMKRITKNLIIYNIHVTPEKMNILKDIISYSKSDSEYMVYNIII